MNRNKGKKVFKKANWHELNGKRTYYYVYPLSYLTSFDSALVKWLLEMWAILLVRARTALKIGALGNSNVVSIKL